MNDKDITKALECCIKSNHLGDCFWNGCPLVSEHGCKVGKETLYPYAIDLIKRQQAEIEILKIVIETSCVDIKTARAEAIKEFTERWHNTLKETRNRGFLKEPTIVSKTFEIASNITNIVVKEMFGKEDEMK